MQLSPLFQWLVQTLSDSKDYADFSGAEDGQKTAPGGTHGVHEGCKDD